MARRGERTPRAVGRFRIAVVAYTEYPWDPRVRDEAEAASRAGHDVHVIALRPSSGSWHGPFGGVHLWEVPLAPRRGGRFRYLYQYLLFFLLSGLVLLRLHFRERFDVVHVHSLPDFQVFVALPLWLTRAPVVLDLHEALPEIVAARFGLSLNSPLTRFAGVIEQLSCRYANRIIVANDGIRAAVELRGVPHSKLVTIYNSVQIPETLASSREIREQLGLQGEFILVHAGGVNRERDLETFLRALKEVAATVDVRLVVAGRGEESYVQCLHRLAEDLGLSNRTHFVGRVNRQEALALMAQAPVGVVTAERSVLADLAWPTRIVEFAALGKPLIVPRLRFMTQMLRDSACYYQPGDCESLANCLRDLLTNSEARRTYGNRARSFAKTFDSSKVREQLLDTYRVVASGRGVLET